MRHDVAPQRHYLDCSLIQVARVRRDEANPGNVYPVQIEKQISKRVTDIGKILAVGVDVLSEKRDLFITARRQFLDFRDYVAIMTRPFLSARVRNDTVTTKLIASVHDIYPRFLRERALHRNALDNFPLFRIHPHNLFFGKIRVMYIFAQAMKIMGSENNIDMRVFFHHFKNDGFFLGHATAQSY